MLPISTETLRVTFAALGTVLDSDAARPRRAVEIIIIYFITILTKFAFAEKKNN